jgi:uncharacterized metal-binding protein
MSSGIVHGRATKAISPFVFVIVFICTNDFILATYGLIGCLLGLFIEPDLDVDHTTMSERRIQDVSFLLGRIYYFIWLPYAKLLPHRSFLSHTPVLSTSIRYIYISAWVLAVPLLLGFWPIIRTFVLEYQDELVWLFIGTCVSDTMHFIFDQF